jgi:3-deoxy-manno-octulosonate cytidylyltransferase (CMP-KDO synthetase)
VIIATDDFRIAGSARSHGFDVQMTSPRARSGTDRVAEVAASLDFDVIVNVQGDEPLIEPSTIDAAIQPLLDDPTIEMSTTSETIDSVEDVFSSAVVKVVTDPQGFALYFSRAPIPYIRSAPGVTLEETLRREPALLKHYRKHSGLYAYRRHFLHEFAAMPETPLERLEALEQMRAIENGRRIRVVPVEHRSVGVDTEQDYNRVKKMIEENRE